MKSWLLIVWTGLLCVALSGCGDDHRSRLRAVHASPDAPNVDVLIDGKKVLTNVAYATSSAYLNVSSGSRRIQVNATGATTSVIDATVTLNNKQDYTLLAVDKLASIAPLLLTDNNTAPASGQIKVRIVHASPSAGPVDVYVTAPGADITTATPTLTNVPFKAASDYLNVAAGSYQIRVTPTGTKVVAIDSGSVTLQAGQIRTVVALDAQGGGTPLQAIILADLN